MIQSLDPDLWPADENMIRLSGKNYKKVIHTACNMPNRLQNIDYIQSTKYSFFYLAKSSACMTLKSASNASGFPSLILIRTIRRIVDDGGGTPELGRP